MYANKLQHNNHNNISFAIYQHLNFILLQKSSILGYNVIHIKCNIYIVCHNGVYRQLKSSRYSVPLSSLETECLKISSLLT